MFFKEQDNSLIDLNWGINDNKSLPDPKIINDPSNTYPTLVFHGFNDHCQSNQVKLIVELLQKNVKI